MGEHKIVYKVLAHPTTGERWKYDHSVWSSKFEPGKKLFCWEWTGAKHRDGYGMVGVIKSHSKNSHSGMMNAQRLAMAIKLGRPLEHNEFVRAFCKNKKCVNPHHLEMKTSVVPLPEDRSEWFTKHKEQMENLSYKEAAEYFEISDREIRLLKVAYRKWKSKQNQPSQSSDVDVPH